MSIESMKDYIIKVYGDTIHNRPVTHMSDCQIIAIYNSIQARGKKPPKDIKGEKYEQLSFL